MSATHPLVCRHCGSALISTARFCHQCGGKVSAGPAAEPGPQETPETASPVPQTPGEKRLATIMFADMSGSVEATRDLHPEDALAVASRLLNVMASAITEHGGRVIRFLGDGVLAVFGMSQANESDPDRAILAALRIRGEVKRLGFQSTVGINTGEVYAGEVGTGPYHEVTVIGAVVNLASRLQGVAEPGEILVGETTLRLGTGSYRTQSRTMALKGLPQPVTAFLVDGVAGPHDAGWSARPRGVLVGRVRELELLRQALKDAVGGRGGVVLVIAEPGVGKSRLLEALQSDAAKGTSVPELRDCRWLRSRCLEIGAGVPYSPFVRLVQRWLDRPEDAVESSLELRFEEGVGELLRSGHLQEREASDLRSFLLPLLLGHAAREPTRTDLMEQDLPRHVLFQAFRSLFQALSQVQPLVLAMEDLHWADSLSIELLGFLTELASSSRLVLLGTARTEPAENTRQIAQVAARRFPESYLELELSELGAEDSCRLVYGVLGEGYALSEELRSLVVERCRGNPLFIEEILRALQDAASLRYEEGTWRIAAGSAPHRTPESVQSVIQSRVDRLSPRLKHVLQVASVLGTAFNPRLLLAVGLDGSDLAPAISELTSLGLFSAHPESPQDRLAFKHALTRDTVYDTIMRPRRREFHRRVAEVMEARYADRLETRYEAIARHFALGDCPDRAAEYLIHAGVHAMRLFANREAAAHFDEAVLTLELLRDSAEVHRMRLVALEGLGDVQFRTGAHHLAEEQFARALALAERDAHSGEFARLSWKLADALHWQLRLDEAVRLAQDALEAAAPERFGSDVVRLLEVVMRSYWARNDLESARVWGDRLEQILPQVSYFPSLYMIYYALAWLEIKCRDFGRARYWLETMRVTCGRHQDEVGLSRCYHGFGDLCRATGEYAEAAGWFGKSVELCERTGDAHLLMEGHLEWAQVLILTGCVIAEAEPHIRCGLGIAEEMSSAGAVSSIQALCNAVGRALVTRGDERRALHFFQMAFTFGTHPSPETTFREVRAIYVRENRLSEFDRYCVEQGYPQFAGREEF